MVILKHKKFILTLVIFLMVLGGFLVYQGVLGISALEACNRSEECKAAKAKEEEANRNAAAAVSTSNAYQNKVNELNTEIAAKEAKIAETKAKIGVLKDEITKKEIELNAEQEALAEILVNMHFESDTEPIVVLAGANSISDLAERAAREEVAKEQISVAVTKIRKAKEVLEADKAEVEDLLAEQERSKQELNSKKDEQQSLVEKYANDAEAYNAMATAAREEKQRAIEQYIADHPEVYSGTTSPYAGYDTYPWQADCPGRQDEYITVWDGYKIGGYVCECVSYAGWKAYEAYGVPAAWGNAYSWDDGARADGYTVNNTPAAQTIGQTDSGYYGHVFWVESVNGDGSINVTEYNNAYATQLYSGGFHAGDFGARTIPASQVWQYNFIHF